MRVADFRSIASSIGNSLGKNSNGGSSGGDLIPEDYFYNPDNITIVELFTRDKYGLTKKVFLFEDGGDIMISLNDALECFQLVYKNGIKIGCASNVSLGIRFNINYQEGDAYESSISIVADVGGKGLQCSLIDNEGTGTELWRMTITAK